MLVRNDNGFWARHGIRQWVMRMFEPRAQYFDHRLQSLIVLEYGSIAIVPGTFVVIVRYFTRAWGRRLQEARLALCGVAYFVDDDLLAGLADGALPWRYRLKLFSNFAAHRGILSSVCSEIWVSTPQLAERYRLGAQAIVEPRPLVESGPTREQVTYFSAGSASHIREFKWLRELVGELQSHTSTLTFITFGGNRVRRLFRGLPRVLCLHPVTWQTFTASVGTMKLDVGLAPLLGGTFNDGRSYTKFFDHTRLGAVGVYSDGPPYDGFIKPDLDGVLVANDQQAWYSAVLKLAAAPEWRAGMLAAARSRVFELSGSEGFGPWRTGSCGGERPGKSSVP